MIAPKTAIFPRAKPAFPRHQRRIFHPRMQHRIYDFNYDSGTLNWDICGTIDERTLTVYELPADRPLWIPLKKQFLPLTPSNSVFRIYAPTIVDFTANFIELNPAKSPPYSAVHCYQEMMLDCRLLLWRDSGGGSSSPAEMMARCMGRGVSIWELDSNGYDPTTPTLSYPRGISGQITFDYWDMSFSPSNNGDASPINYFKLWIQVRSTYTPYAYTAHNSGTARIQIPNGIRIFGVENV